VVELQPESLLRALAVRGVDFVVIGGIAAVLHGSAQNTFDLDITFATDPTNLELLGEALIDLKASLRAGSENIEFVPDHRLLRKVDVLTMNTPLGHFDVLARPKGAPPYEQLRASATRVRVDDFGFLIASIDDLIAMKLAAGRPKDLVAVDELRVIKRLTGP
jgi:predicted nucleotidyltransferase